MNARGGWNGQPSPPSGFDEYVFPMSFAQQRLWFLDAVAPGNPFYNIPLRIPMGGRIDPGAVERALNAIIGRHEALRTTFEVIDSEPSQVVRSPRTIVLAHRRVDHLPPATSPTLSSHWRRSKPVRRSTCGRGP